MSKTHHIVIGYKQKIAELEKKISYLEDERNQYKMMFNNEREFAHELRKEVENLKSKNYE